MPHSRAARVLIILGGCCALLSCDSRGLASSGPVASPAFSVGPDPTLPDPAAKRLIPTVIIATATGWRGNETPTASAGLQVNAFATQLAHPRWLYVLPNGDVLVAESNAPARPEENQGLRAKVMGRVMAKAGAGAPSANRITLLRDADGDGVAEFSSVFLDQLTSPFGMALIGTDLYVANTDSIMRFRYQPGQTKIDARGVHLTALPAGTRNHHWTKNIIASVDGTNLYASVGSNSNVAEHGMAVEEGRACIWEVDVNTGAKQLFATGLRNPNGMAWEPTTGELWTVVNERDELGNDLVPDYLTTVKGGRFYGWPYSYFGQHVDVRVEPRRPELVAAATPPDYALGAHVAALGLSYAGESALPSRFRHGMFIGEHGSWNRDPPVGYKVVFVPFANGKPSGPPIDVLGGFVTAQGEARGRPVGVVMDSTGALLVADDVGNTVWRVTGTRPETANSSR